ncbi:MAG: hypothetical protein KKH61_21355 [Gammaproteobacteria bacterium]|uniref:Glycine-rich domain-containing protein n=1 Tax=viral metagenome TaxID=1070528 RepID=A0A6H1Z9S5_9ZZZZ|nr:hypothetical protein [Gammaproteobacteria bacterium]
MPGSFNPPTIQGSIKRQTTNYNFLIPTFDAPGWGASLERNFDVVDSILYTVTGIGNVQGAWDNSTTYAVAVRVVDTSDDQLWQCYVAHTSAASGTFAADRAANPTYWRTVVNGVVPRGDWVTATGYNPSEIVTDNGRTGVCQAIFTSSASYDQDVIDGNIVTIVDTSAFSDFNTAIAAASALTTLATGDLLGVVDVSDTNNLKKITYANLAAQLLADTALTGVPSAPTASAGTNTTQVATTAFVTAAINVVLGGVSATYDTLAEVAVKLGTIDTDIAALDSAKMAKAANLSDVASAATAFSNIKQAASDTATGVVELATDAEAQALSDTTRVLTPAALAAVTATETRTGVVELATTAEAEAGTDTARATTPAGLLSFANARDALAVQRFTSSGTWTKPSFGTFAIIYAWGAGGSGARGATPPRAGGGGGGGAYIERILPLADLAATVAVGIGAGGAAVASPSFPGAAGGDTTFGAHVTAYGGGGASSSPSSDNGGGGGGGGGIKGAGASTASSTAGGVGGADIYGVTAAAGVDGVDMGGGGGGSKSNSGGDGSLWGGGGGAGGDTTGITDGVGGNAVYGGAGGGGGNDDDTAGAGGTSLFGGNGGAGATGSGNATSGSIPGGGGGGCATGTSGAGARGELWVIVV